MGAVSGTPPLTYPANSNNPVQHHPRVYLIFWGPNWTSTDSIVTTSQAMFTNIAGTVYNAILTQYYSQDSTGVKTFISNDAQLAGSYLDASNSPGAINDSSVNGEISAVIAAKGWVNSSDTQFALFPQAGATYTGSGFCAFHSVTSTGAYVYDMQPYLNDPNFSSGTVCINQYGNGSFTVAMNTVLSHEYAEAATDPQANGSGWVQAGTLTEIGDLCASSVGISGAVTGASVQMLWDNISDRCVTYAASSYVTAVQANGPTVFYRLGENFSGALVTQATNSALPSVNPSNNATYSSAATQGNPGAIYGDPDTAAGFPNSSATVTSSGNGLPAGASARTVEAWFQTSTASASQSILAYGSQSNANYFMLSLETTGTDIHVAGWNDNVDFGTTPSLADGKWHYIAVTYDGTTVIKLYVDGQYLSQGNLTLPLNTTVPGSGLSIGYGADGTFAGNLDDVAIYPTVLTPTQLTGHFQSRGGWVNSNPVSSPSARNQAGLAYHAGTNKLVLFGGSVSLTPQGDTWTWDGTAWTKLSPSSAPSARFAHTMVYDAALGKVVLFGGQGLSHGNPVYLADTWTWDGSNWTLVRTKTSPLGRREAVMAYDSVRQVVVLFGGYTGLSGGPYLNDTWTFNGANWTQQHPTNSPSARHLAGMTFDGLNGNAVLFGGTDQSGTYLGDTWLWNGSNWGQQSPMTSPPAREAMVFAFDNLLGASVMFGGDYCYGCNPYLTYLNDTWYWNGSNWSQQTPLVTPPNKASASMAYLPSARTLVMFGGGNSNGLANDTWNY